MTAQPKHRDVAMMAPKDARREVRRCRDNLAAGGPPAFWLTRLSAAADIAFEVAAILNQQIAVIRKTLPHKFEEAHDEPSGGCDSCWECLQPRDATIHRVAR